MAKNRKELAGSSDRVGEGTEAPQNGASLEAKPKRMMDVWTMDEKFRTRIGVAFLNEDGSMNVLLNALPVNRKLRIVERTHAETPDKS